jgi:hypothetical protein
MRMILCSMVSLMLLSGCDARSVSVDIDTSRITYSRDARTDLCFAALGRAPGSTLPTYDVAESFSITNVPCSEKVLRQVIGVAS